MTTKENWMTLFQKTSFSLQYGRERLQKLSFFAEKCFLGREQILFLEKYAEMIRKTPLLLENYSKLLSILEEGIGSAFKGRINDNLIEEPFPASFYGDIPEKTFLLLLALSCIPAGEMTFRKQNIAVEKLYEALDEFSAWSSNCFRNFHLTGLDYKNGFAWLVFRILPGIVLRFGRLEYNPSLFFPDFLVFRHRKNGTLAVLANKQYDVNKEGNPAAEGEEIAFRTISPAGIFGSYTANPVASDGRTQKETLTVDLKEYECILRPGDEVLYMHIPELGALTPEKVQHSFRLVQEFYTRKNSGFHPKGIICASWLFGNVLQDLLPENANLVLFQKTGHLLPPRTLSSDVIRRVFGEKARVHGIDKVPWNSSLQKVLGEYLSKGGIFRGGGYFRLWE